MSLRTTVGRITHQRPGLGDDNCLVSFSHSSFAHSEVLLPAHKHSREALFCRHRPHLFSRDFVTVPYKTILNICVYIPLATVKMICTLI